MSDNIIYHDFAQPNIEVIFTPESDDTLFSGSYWVQPCLFGYEVYLELDWMSKPVYLPDFYPKEWVAQRAGRKKLEEMIEELDTQLDFNITGMFDDN